MHEAHNLRRIEASKKEARTGAAEEKFEVAAVVYKRKQLRRPASVRVRPAPKAREGAADEEDEQEEGEKEVKVSGSWKNDDNDHDDKVQGNAPTEVDDEDMEEEDMEEEDEGEELW